MKLPISLIVLAALGHAASPQSGDKDNVFKSSAAKEGSNNQTIKRELFEGNFMDRDTKLLAKLVAARDSQRIEYDKNEKLEPTDQPQENQIYGGRLPQIAKISDVLTGQGLPFDEAVANHLYSPVSVYQAREISSPTSFEVRPPAASETAYPETNIQGKHSKDEQKPQEASTKESDQPKLKLNNVEVLAIKQPEIRYESYPRLFAPDFFRQQSSYPQDIFRQTPQFPREPLLQLIPLYNEFGPNRYQGLPLPFLQQKGLLQMIPINPGYDYINQEGKREEEKESPKQESHEEVQTDPTERPKVEETSIPRQPYHTHPSAAVSFASFTQNLPTNEEPATAPQPQPEISSINQEQNSLPPQHQPNENSEPHAQKQNSATFNQQIQFPSPYQQYFQQRQHFQPELQRGSQFINYQQPIQNRPIMNSLQELIFGDRYLPRPQTIQFQRIPAFKPLPQSFSSTQSFFKPSSTLPVAHDLINRYKPLQPRPFGYNGFSIHNPSHVNQLIPQQQFKLPPLNPNFSYSVKPLDPNTHTSTVFSTPSTLIGKPILDQPITSTTAHPEIHEHETSKEQSIHSETKQHSQPQEVEISHQINPTTSPQSIQSSTHQPFATYKAQSDNHQYSTPQPDYLSTINPQSIRHEVVIQQQEVQELVLEPPHPSSTPQNHPQQNQQLQDEQLTYELLPQSPQHVLEQLRFHQYEHELQKLQSQLAQQHVAQEIQSQQYHSQHQSQSFNHQFPQKQQLNQIQSQKQQQDTQQVEHDQIQNQKHITSQQEHELQQAQQYQDQQNLNPQQYQDQQSLDPQQNQLQVSTPQPPEKSQQELQNQPSPQPQLQYQLEHASTTESQEQPDNSPITPNLREHFSGPTLSPIQTDLPQIYAQPQAFAFQPELGSALGASAFPDVQYFGNFAESIFGGRQR